MKKIIELGIKQKVNNKLGNIADFGKGLIDADFKPV